VYELTPAPDGVFDALEALHASGELETRFSIPAHMEVHREPDSGAVYLRPSFEAEPGAHLTLSTSLPAAAAAPAFTDGELRTFAENVVAELGIQEADTARRRVVRRVLARVPRPANPADPVGAMEIRTKGLDLMLRRGIRVGPRVFPVFGNGGLVEVEVGADRTLRGISKIWRTKGAVTRQVRLKSDKDVKAEAKRLIPNAQLYKVTSVVLGYEEQAGNAPQDELVPVFEVSLDPINPANRFTAPPTEVQVPAE
jgi:hypothetical protein